MATVTGAHFHLEYRDEAAWRSESVSFAERARYLELRADERACDWSWQVPRNAAARVLADVAVALGRLHATGEVHGDLKPANVLLTADGAHLFDSLKLAPGVRAPAMTRGWAAPEQVLGNPVGFATDQYAMGMLLLRLVDGVLYGEETRVLIPVGGTRLEAHTVMRNPGVYIDTDSAPVQPSAVEAWRGVIERCIRFEPSERFASTGELEEALRRLCERDGLVGDLRVPVSFGRAVMGQDASGRLTPAWLSA
jgi:serine/threonine protein kinase